MRKTGNAIAFLDSMMVASFIRLFLIGYRSLPASDSMSQIH